jgi:hypothetical protein
LDDQMFCFWDNNSIWTTTPVHRMIKGFACGAITAALPNRHANTGYGCL